MGIKLKIIFILVLGMVALSIFLPDRAEEAIEMISESTGISEDKISRGVEFATDVTKDSAELIKDKAVEIKDDAVESLDN